MTERTILIDGDILVYQSAQQNEKEICWDEAEGLWSIHAELHPAIVMLNDQIFGLQEKLGADHVVLALTDPVNWRKDVLPTYKSNRADKRKPMLIPALRAYLESEEFTGAKVYRRPTLEGDDILGILMTHSHLVKGEKICVSLDKDMKTLPGFHYNQRKDHDGIFEVTPAEADEWHMIQALAGDTTDGYAGCPGIGMAKATEFVKERKAAVMVSRTITRGPRKGQVVTEPELITQEDATLWDIVVSHYRAAGLTEHEALIQARVARILRATDYDFKKKELKLWTP
jgi:5'-3' exonuclease